MLLDSDGLKRFTLFSDPERAYTCLATTVDGSLCAVGDDHGLVWLWRTPYYLSFEQLLLLILLYQNQNRAIQELSPYWQELYNELDPIIRARLQRTRTIDFLDDRFYRNFLKIEETSAVQERLHNALRKPTRQYSLRKRLYNRRGRRLYDQPCRRVPKHP